MAIPDSISAMVFSMRHPLLWTIAVTLTAIVTFAMMTSRSDTYVGIAFVSCTCIAFVGAMPLIANKENKVHYILAIIGAVLSQLWCLLVLLPTVYPFLLYWLVYLLILPLTRHKWCLVAELWAVVAVWTIAFSYCD